MQSTLGDYVYSELRRGYVLENDQQRYTERREKFYTFLKIPLQLEKVRIFEHHCNCNVANIWSSFGLWQFLWYGFFQCADAFLFVFTLLPIRFALSIWFLITRSLKRLFDGRGCQAVSGPGQAILQPAEICDLLKGVILIISAILMNYVDTSMLYHIIKSQSVIKLYIFFNMLEVSESITWVTVTKCSIYDCRLPTSCSRRLVRTFLTHYFGRQLSRAAVDVTIWAFCPTWQLASSMFVSFFRVHSFSCLIHLLNYSSSYDTGTFTSDNAECGYKFKK